MAATTIKKLGGFVTRHRFAIWDMAVLLAGATMLVLLGLEHDLLLWFGFSEAEAARVELAEAALIALLLGVFLFVNVKRMKAQQRELKQRIAAEERVRELAFEDPLTGLPNRRQFDEVVATAVASPPGADRMHAVLLMDLNRFKSVNDVFGHPTGDAVLQEIGLRLASVVRETGDHVARLGGDEFGIVATHIRSADAASGIALRIVAALKAPVSIGETSHSVGIAIGIALFPRDGDSAQEIIRRADVALYKAKAEPESSLHFFEEEMDVQLRERAALEAELRRALAAGDIHLHYQPVIDLGTGKVTGFEALARWNHSTFHEVPPSRFIPIAEECGLINELGEHLLAAACRDACHWPAYTTLSFNVSPVQLRGSAFASRVLAILQETGLPPNRLEIELTENTLVRDLKLAERALGGLREAGVRIALDDFGTGYSSLYHLRNFKVDRIKIDRSFVESMTSEVESGAIVRALLGLGHGLGVQITAEGIENMEQMNALVSQGCGHGQGFMFSAAMPAAEARAIFGEEGQR